MQPTQLVSPQALTLDVAIGTNPQLHGYPYSIARDFDAFKLLQITYQVPVAEVRPMEEEI